MQTALLATGNLADTKPHNKALHRSPRWASVLPDQSSGISADDLDRVKEAVARSIELERTWGNLDHAITVRSVSAQSLGINDLGLSEE
jgi:hypothetical protein